jgi:hypothetical protein
MYEHGSGEKIRTVTSLSPAPTTERKAAQKCADYSNANGTTCTDDDSDFVRELAMICLTFE